MKRKTLLLILLPLAVVIAAAAFVGFYAAHRMPTPAQVDDSQTLDEARRYRVSVESWDDYISLSFEVAALAVIVAAAVVVIHVSRMEKVRAWREKVFRGNGPPGREAPFIAATLAVTIVLSGLMMMKANSASLAPEGDEISYLEAAVNVKEKYGAIGFAGALYSGEWGENNRHPLYIWALSPFASRSPAFFAYARMISAFFGAVSIAVVCLVVWRLFGVGAASVTTLFYGLNDSFLTMSSSIMGETLLVSLVALSFYFTARGFKEERFLTGAGVAAGLAYMTNLSGLYLPLAFLAAAVFVWRKALFRKKFFYLYFAAFVVAASPLLSRNLVRYHNPVSNYNFRLLWLDKRAQTDTVDFLEGKTGPAKFFKTHKPLSVAVGFFEGGEAALENAAVTVSPLRRALITFRSSRKRYNIRRASGFVILAISSVLLLLDTDPFRRLFAVFLALGLWASMAWYARIVVAPRFVLPFMPLVLAYFAVGLVNAVGAWTYKAGLCVAVSALAFVSVTERLDILRPFKVAAPSADAMTLADWLDGNLDSGDVYLMADESLRFGWFRKVRGRQETVPNTEDVRSLVEASRGRGARYVVISRWLFQARHLQFSGAFVFLDQDLAAAGPIPGWRQVFVDPRPPVDYIVYEVVSDGEESEEGGI